jgi:outer membrane protein OmpA-like peptidoglycan-associated protein
MTNLLDSLKAYITPELLGSAAQTLGENENGISKALGGLAPTILAGLLEKSSDTNAMSGIFNTISNFDSSVLDNLGGLVGGGNLAHNDPKDIAGQLLGTIFGAKVPSITSAIAAFSGVKQSSASSLLGVAGPMVMGLLSKKISSEGLNLSGLVSLLAGQKSNILNMLPAGIGSVLGLSGLSSATAATTGNESTTGNRWLMPLLLLLGLGAAVIFYLRNCSKPTVSEVKAPIAAVIDSAAIKAAAAAKAATATAAGFMKKLASGFEIKGSADGIETKLIAFIEDATKPVDKTTWFNFDHLNFKTGSAELDMDYSKQQLTNIYEVLKAFPKVKLKIGGYTDSDGDDKANMALSQKRAENVKAALITMGIDKARLAAEGYGEQHPECPANDTPECKAKNRRIAVRVTEK